MASRRGAREARRRIMWRRPPVLAQGSRAGLVIALALIAVIAVGIAYGAIRTRTFSSGSITKGIPDEGSIEQTIRIGEGGRIKDVDASVRISHTFDQDLQLLLQHPTGTTVLLAGGEGDVISNVDYGSGAFTCAGTPTTFDDEASTSIDDASAPFAGRFRPEERLSQLDGKQLEGKWRLIVVDNEEPDGGILHCVRLRVRFNTD
jgi:subtilisin-like proprotein convertase family protein